MLEPATSVTSVVGNEAAKAFGGIFAKMAVSAMESTCRSILRSVENITRGFGEYLEVTYEKCTKVKTILSHDGPENLLSLYVTTKFENEKRTIVDFDFIKEAQIKKRIIVSGTAGGGKTVFMKYLWVSFFEDPRGHIPVFFELRRLNDITSDDLLPFVYNTIINSRGTITLEQFRTSIHKGLFRFIFDGFDEVVIEKRDQVERQILELAHQNPECVIVLSGRNDPRFDSWQVFHKYSVLPLGQSEVIKLVNQLNYDRVIKRKFVERVKSDLWPKHNSFLSSPLLATLMLLTFHQYADIPEKIHIFYDQAFDTLFSRHDASKEAFKRKMYTGLPIDEFKRHLSYFCLLTYYREQLTFSESDILLTLKDTKKAHDVSIEGASFMQDLLMCVCVLQQDGLVYTFTHRSFQEFFSAYCLAREDIKSFGQIIEKISRRGSDSAISMLFEMNPAKLEDKFIIHKLTQYVRKVRRRIPSDPFDKYRSIAGNQILVELERDNNLYLFRAGPSNIYAFLLMLDRIYPSSALMNVSARIERAEAAVECLVAYLQTIKQQPSALFEISMEERLRVRAVAFSHPVGGSRKARDKLGLIDFECIRESKISVCFDNLYRDMANLLRDIRKKRQARDTVIDNIFA